MIMKRKISTSRLILATAVAAIPAMAITAYGTPGSASLRGADSETATRVQQSADSLSVTAADSLAILQADSLSRTLDEFVVTFTKPLVQNDGATLTYNVEEDPDSKSNSVMEMLRKVPMVTVDAEENIKVKGSSNFKIYMNGKENPMLSGDPKTVLKSMPASTIKKIEVITDPGAKYDAEGTGGILNIVTTGKQTLEGYTANLSAWGGNSNVGASAYGRTKIHNVTAGASFSWNDNFVDGFKRTGEGYTENLTSETERLQRNTSESDNRWNYVGGNLSLSWEPDTLNLYTLEGYIGSNFFNSKTDYNVEMLSAGGEKVWSLRRKNSSTYDGLWANVQGSYQHTFGRQGHHIIGTYLFNFGKDNSDNVYETSDAENYSEPFPWRRTDYDSYMGKHTLQIDYANPMGEHNTLEAGLKGSWTLSRGTTSPYYGSDADDALPRQSELMRLNQYQDIMAAYVSHTGDFGKFATRVGVRYEHTRMGIDYKVAGYDNFKTILNDWVPNASVTYRLNSSDNFRLAYQMRINRPGIDVLNPFRNTMSINSVSYGNPDLKSVMSHSVSLGFNHYGMGKVNGSVSVGYRRENNQIESYSFMRDNILHSTYANLGHYQEIYLNGNIQWTIIPDMTLGVYAYADWEQYKIATADLRRKKCGWMWNYNADWSYRLPHSIRLSAYGGQGSGWFNLDYEGKGWYYYGLSVSKSFLKNDALSISASLQNLLPSYRNHSYSSSGEGYRQWGSQRIRFWNARISISWRFGNLSADVKRTDANIESDGTVNGSSQGGGSQGGGGGR